MASSSYSHFVKNWQEWRDSNPRPSVLETDALPTELHSYALPPAGTGGGSFSIALLTDLFDDARADGPAALADGEAQALVHGDRLDQLDRHARIVARHHHLGAL